VEKNTSGREDCARCHTEHYGHDFNIVKWQPSRTEFDHRQTGYALAGKHAGVACERCHNAQHVSKAERPSIQMKDVNHSYLGVSPECTTCHTDEHRGQLGSDCARCHSLDSWKPPTGFDHGKTRYPLTGLHSNLACKQCHPTRTDDGTSFVQYKNPTFASCTGCHKDPHHGAFTAPCQNCHATFGWKQVRMTSNFNHDMTKFPLLGAHARTACFDCHKGTDFKQPIAHAQCADCHTPDPHKGQFQGQDCDRCHNENSFKPALFTVTMHQQSTYPLLGRHASVECAKCHVPAGKDTHYRMSHDACLDCHKDAHAGQFVGARYGNKCEQCHTENGFRPSTFTLARHQETRFQLAGGHAATACGECHKPAAGADSRVPAQYHFESLACTNCHQDPHHGLKATADNRGCEVCHNVTTWKQTAAFDHSTTKYVLLGAHRAVKCLECHRPVIGKGPRAIIFQDTPTACTGCHEDIHGGQFAKSDNSTDCTMCHSMAAWMPSTFNHERLSAFSLQGAHERVPCLDCHRQRTTLAGKAVTVYRNVSSRCIDCHAAQ
jgi:predicted CXXCH cytochrome family protein